MVRIFLYSEWMRGFAPWVSVSGPGAGGGGGAGRGGPVFGHFSRSVIGAVFYSARSGFNPTRSLSIFSENIKIFSENIKKLVVV